MKPLADAVRLRMPGLGLCVFYAVYAKEQLVIMRFELTAVFRAPVRQDADDAHFLRGEEGQHPVIQEIGPGDRRLYGVQLGCGPLRIGIHKGLLVDAAYSLDGADIKGVLAAEISGMMALDLAVGLVILFFALQGLHLSFREQEAFLGGFLLQCGKSLRHGGKAMPQPDTAYPGRRNKHAKLAQLVAGPHLPVCGKFDGVA